MNEASSGAMNTIEPWSVVSRPLEGVAPVIDLVVGYSKANTSPILKLFLAKLEELRSPMPVRSGG
jgi:LysR family transcriptional regulator, hca operon transcriptional activator